jgi:hypothetical protein
MEWDRDAVRYGFGTAGIGAGSELPGLRFNSSEIYTLLTVRQLLGGVEQGLLTAQVLPLLERGACGDRQQSRLDLCL